MDTRDLANVWAKNIPTIEGIDKDLYEVRIHLASKTKTDVLQVIKALADHIRVNQYPLLEREWEH